MDIAIMTIQDLLLFFLLIFNLIYLKNNLNIHQIQVLSNKYHFRLPAGKLGTRTAAAASSSAADGKIILGVGAPPPCGIFPSLRRRRAPVFFPRQPVRPR